MYDTGISTNSKGKEGKKKKKIERKTREKMRLWTSFARTICQWQQQREKRGMKCMYKHTGALEERRRAKEDAFLIEEKKLNYLWVKRMYVCVNVYVCVWERGGASTVGLTKNIKKKKKKKRIVKLFNVKIRGFDSFSGIDLSFLGNKSLVPKGLEKTLNTAEYFVDLTRFHLTLCTFQLLFSCQ